jgi:hypothetical protein
MMVWVYVVMRMSVMMRVHMMMPTRGMMVAIRGVMWS